MLDEIKETMQKLQEKIEKLEKENQELKNNNEIKEPEKNERQFEILDDIGNYAVQEIKKIIEETPVKAVAICIDKTVTIHSSGTNISSACMESFDDINEEGTAAALEIFTNPRRIAILKVLIAHPSLTATEITQKTGLVGGQLYHHLSNLENAGLIIKENEKYKVHVYAQGILVSLQAVLGRMNIAKN